MSEPDSTPPPDRSAATEAWQSLRPAPDLAGTGDAFDPPTVRSGSIGSSSPPARTGSSATGTPLPLPGDRIDSFVLEESIGVGGMGAVFRALDLRLDRHVALKILPPEQARDPEVVQRFYQEGRAAARLDHENIARVFTIGHDALYHFIAFEYIEGTTIRQRVERNGPLSVSEAINYTLQIATALVHASERGVVHRDIKPSNIIVTPQGRAKLVDMGLARRFERGGDDGLTQSGMTLGTFDYISPEQARDPRDVDVRSDLYSLGCTLFHMLGGRPPFPEGTVLQKLIQHQEEVPPDIRELNPLVPVELANVLSKLMAKDRDRRYQTPEQLVRDLLIIAGTLGLRSVSPEGLVWMSAARPAAWEQHLIWGVPVLAFAVVVAGLVWWGQETSAPPVISYASVPELRVKPVAAKNAAEPKDAVLVGSDPKKEPAPPPTESVPPRDISLDSSDDLLARLAVAPARSIVVLNDDGPYLIGDEALDRTSTPRLIHRDLTIKAAAGVRPVIRLAREAPGGEASPAALFDFEGGHITLDGLRFEVSGGVADGLAALRTDGTELTVRRCVFRRTGSRSGTAAHAAAIVARGKAGATSGDRPAAIVVDASHFDPGQAALVAKGAVDVQFRDCTIAASGTAFWFENPLGTAGTPVELRLKHDSIVAGNEPVFRFEGSDPRIWVDDTVIAPGRDAELSLVSADEPARLSWSGRANLFGRVGTFLQSSDSHARFDPVRDAARWSESLAGVRETGSSFTSEPVWDEADPAQSLTQDAANPSRAFRIAQSRADRSDAGARQGPFGTLASGTRLVALAPDAPRDRPRSPEPRPEAPSPMPPAAPTVDPDFPAPMPKPANSPGTPMPPPANPETGAEPMTMPPMRRDETPAVAEQGEPARAENRPAPASSNPPAAVAAATSPNVPITADSGLVQTTEQFREALRQPRERGSILRVAPDADIELARLAVDGNDHWILRAERGPKPPRIRFRPSAQPSKNPSNWEAGIELSAGALQLEGFDIILPRPTTGREGRWAAFGLGLGAELTLINCTVTVEGESPDSAAFIVRAPDHDRPAEAGARKPPRLRLTDCLVRSGGDLIDVGAAVGIELDMNNAVISTGGSMLHAHGCPRGTAGPPVKLDIELRQVSARTAGGLVLLESAAGEPDLPVADVSARDSVLTTTLDGDPLLRVDGQDALSTLSDRIRWEGHRVAYHQITAYRRDQSAQIGSVPNIYDRPSWNVAVGPKEADPIHGDLKFIRDWDAERPAWLLNRDDMRLATDSPARASGADLPRIPVAPSGL
ncbi:MAG: protein kinase [Isosphaeraceae bacterium]|nr:protein kinase [Isosphaeraceae bacterium]